MDAMSLNYWLSNFMMEIAIKGGESYPPKTVYGIVRGVRRYLEEEDASEALIHVIRFLKVAERTNFV